MKKSLGLPLFLGLAGLQLVAVLVIVFSSYVTSEKVLIYHANNLLRNVGINTMEHSRGFLKPAHDAAELAVRLAQNKIVASDDPELLEQLLFQQLQLASQVAGMYYGDEEGGFVFVMRDEDPELFRTKIISIDEAGGRSTTLIWRDEDFNITRYEPDPGDTFDPRTRPWYIRASAERDMVWADPYIFFSSRQPGITLASPVYGDDSAVTGVIGVDIEISEISEFLSRLKIGESGRAMIINRNGDVIAGQNQDLLKTSDSDGTLRFVKISEFGDPVGRAAFGGLFGPSESGTTQEVSRQFTLNGDRYVSLAMPVLSEALPWTIGVYAPEDDFIAEIKQNRVVNIWIAVAVAIVTGLIGLALANFIHRPLRALAVRSSLVSQGELAPDDPMPRTFRELEQVNTALTQQIAARRNAEREYGLTFELSTRGMAQIAPGGGRFIRVNSQVTDITGYSAEELHGRTFVDLVYKADKGALTHADPGSDEDFSTNRELRMVRADGEVIWVRINAILIRDRSGRALHEVVTLEDVTQEREKEEKITELNRELSMLARGNTMGQLAAGLAHELNQPLGAIAQNAGTALYLVQQQGDGPKGLQEALCEIEGQSLRAGEIIRALRGLVRNDRSRAASFDLRELVEQVLRLVQHEAEEAGVTLRIDWLGGRWGHGNRVQIAQVLLNLLRNAIEAFDGQTRRNRLVTVRVRDGSPPGAVTTATPFNFGRGGEQICLEVEDNGPGVDPGISLFSQFETTKPDGLGLGLSICRSILRANGGRLWHEPNEMGGASFFLTLPVGHPPMPGVQELPADGQV